MGKYNIFNNLNLIKNNKIFHNLIVVIKGLLLLALLITFSINIYFDSLYKENINDVISNISTEENLYRWKKGMLDFNFDYIKGTPYKICALETLQVADASYYLIRKVYIQKGLMEETQLPNFTFLSESGLDS